MYIYEFSSQSTQAKDNYDNFDQTIMNLEVSQIDDHINQAPQPANIYLFTKILRIFIFIHLSISKSSNNI